VRLETAATGKPFLLKRIARAVPTVPAPMKPILGTADSPKKYPLGHTVQEG
jgi:hypothetical protein